MSHAHKVESLSSALRLWKGLAIVSWVALGLALVVTVVLISVERDRALRAAEAEARARAAAQQALEEAERERAAAKERLARAKDERDRLLYVQQLSLAQMQTEEAKQKNALDLLRDAFKK